MSLFWKKKKRILTKAYQGPFHSINFILLKPIPKVAKFFHWYRVAKFESKVGSWRTTRIGNLVVLDIFLVALILIPYNMQCKMIYVCWKRKG